MRVSADKRGFSGGRSDNGNESFLISRPRTASSYRRSRSIRPPATLRPFGTTRGWISALAVPVTRTVSPTTTFSSGARSAPTAAPPSQRTFSSVQGPPTRVTPGMESTMGTTRGCPSSVESPIRRGPTTPTARVRTPMVLCTSWTSIPLPFPSHGDRCVPQKHVTVVHLSLIHI